MLASLFDSQLAAAVGLAAWLIVVALVASTCRAVFRWAARRRGRS